MSEPKGTYGRFIPTALWLSDLAVVNLLFAFTICLCPEVAQSPRIRTLWVLVSAAYLPILIWLRPKPMQYRAISFNNVVSHALTVVVAHALVFIALILFTQITIPLRALGIFYGLMLVAIPFWWALTRHIIKVMRRRGYNFLRVIVVGSGPTARRLIEEIKSNAGFGLKIVGIFCDNPSPDFKYRVTGGIDDIARFVDEMSVDQIYFTIAGENERQLSTVVKIADEKMIDFFYVPLISRRVSRSFELYNIGSVPVLSIRGNKLKSLYNQAVKRTFDILFSGLFLLVSPIIFIPVAIAIKLSSPGPVFFKQERTGHKGKTFKCWKFRTMRVNKDADSQQATREDARVTRVGAFLRKTSIDELPQFINVFIGDMSVVGPRPHMLKHTEDYSKLIEQYMVRHVVKPGVTGWAQVNGYRGITDELWKMEKRVELDVWYIENWSFLLDLKIILRTVYNGVMGEENAF